MRVGAPRSTLAGMDTPREFDQDTVGDHDVNTLDGSEGLDATVISTDGEDLPIDAPEEWTPVEEHGTLDEKLAAERPDVDSPAPGDDGVSAEPRDPIDDLDPEGGIRVLGEA